MQDFELMRNVTIGQYIPTGSVIHRLDPRTKILAAIFLILGISFNASIIANAIFLVVVLVRLLAGVASVTLQRFDQSRNALYSTGQIELQNHGNTLWFRNLYIRELD